MKEKLKLIKGYFSYLLPARRRMLKGDWKRLKERGHTYPKPFYYHPKRNLGYVLVSKVLSSSICRVMLEWENIPINGELHRLHHKNFFYKSPSPQNIFSFSFVRNPFERLVSAYKNQYKRDWFGGFDIYAFGLVLGRKRVKNFEDFVRRVCAISEPFKEVHIVSQYSLLYDDYGKCRVKFIGKMENVSEDWKYIQSQVNVPDLPHENKTEKNDWRDFYTLELAEKVYQHYYKDFEAFGYTDEYEKLVEYIKDRPQKPKGKNWWEISPLAKDRYPI